MKIINTQRCDVTLTFFNKYHSIIGQRSFTYDIKPTIKDLSARAKELNCKEANLVRATIMHNGSVKTIMLK